MHFASHVIDNAQVPDDILNECNDRRCTFNIIPLTEQYTVEIRLHNGTLNAYKILTWLSLWQQILWTAGPIPETIPEAETGMIPDEEILQRHTSNVIQPSGDLLDLYLKYLPGAKNYQIKYGFLLRLFFRMYDISEQQIKDIVAQNQSNNFFNQWMLALGSNFIFNFLKEMH